jgi:glycosyltransferase involved in cell wall biosynthesis
MIDTPKVSIIIAIYNLARYLPQCLDSVLSQTLREIEIIAVNDGSTDNSLEILEGYARHYSCLKIISQKNQGPAGAVNSGIAVATGEYVGLVANDDWVAQDMFARLYNAAKDADAEMALCNYMICPEGGAERPARFPVEPPITTGNTWLRHLCFTPDFAPALQRCLFRRDWLNAHALRFPMVRNAEDQQMACLVYAHASIVAVVNEPLCFYRVRLGSVSNDKSDRSQINRIEAQLVLAKSLGDLITQERGLPECYPALHWKIADSLLGVEHCVNGLKSVAARQEALQMVAASGYASLLWKHAIGWQQKRRAMKRIGIHWVRQYWGY